MLEVYACIAEEHHPGYVALAVAICLLSMFTAFVLARHVRTVEGNRLRWIALVGYVTGVGIWATHFIAMLAYEPGMPTAYAPIGTAGSVVVAIVMSVAGWWLHLSGHKLTKLFAAPTITAGIAAMHLVGMSAMKTNGEFHYDIGLVAGACFVSVMLASMALYVQRSRLARVPVLPAVLLALAICSLHFGAMAAVTIFPSGISKIPTETISRELLTMAVGSSLLILVVLAVFAIVLDVRVKKTVAEVSRTLSRDPLTDLLNASAFEREGAQMLAGYGEREGGYALVRIGLDGMRKVLENHGRAAAEAALAELGRRLAFTCGDGLAGRASGDEFAALLYCSGPVDSIDKALRAIEQQFAAPIAADGLALTVLTHLGAVRYPAQAGDWDEMRRKAGVALYHAKFESFTSLLIYDAGMERQAAERHELEAALRLALPEGQFTLHYQPIACLHTDGVIGFEALLRWHHPELGNVSPAKFIPLAEATGLMADIGNWVLREACREAARWSYPLKVAVNLSPAQFADGGLVEKIGSALADSGLPAHRLELEITEGLFIEEGEEVLEILREIKALGVRIAMDDFGTGFSSLGYFRRFPFDKVKIDQSFVRDMVANRQSLAIVKAVVAIGRALDIIVLAEGVETAQQREILAIEGCHQVQGYWIGKPLPPEFYRELTHRVGTDSHPCCNRCDECLERLRPPCRTYALTKMPFYVTRG